jgi:hypothetical protein
MLFHSLVNCHTVLCPFHILSHWLTHTISLASPSTMAPPPKSAFTSTGVRGIVKPKHLRIPFILVDTRHECSHRHKLMGATVVLCCGSIAHHKIGRLGAAIHSKKVQYKLNLRNNGTASVTVMYRARTCAVVMCICRGLYLCGSWGLFQD